jgi:hypothetical protein
MSVSLVDMSNRSQLKHILYQLHTQMDTESKIELIDPNLSWTRARGSACMLTNGKFKHTREINRSMLIHPPPLSSDSFMESCRFPTKSVLQGGLSPTMPPPGV